MPEAEVPYVCTLDKATVKKAEKELNEKPKERTLQVEALRDWVQRQPHLTSRTDDNFLLRFLRRAKFSQLKAQELLDHFWTVRSVPEVGAPEWFANMNPLDPKLQKVMDLAYQLPLPGRDALGRKVVLIRTGAYDPKTQDFGDLMKMGFMTTDVLLKEEETQVSGVVVLLDFSEFSAAHVYCWDRATVQKAMKCWQDVYPVRNKAVNYYNTPTVFNAVFEIFKLFMSEKLKSRLHFHKGDLDALHKQIPKSMLPEEYGGRAGPLKQIAQKWKEELIANKGEFDWNARFGVDASKRLKVDKTDMSVSGSFRKLAVD